VVMGTGVLLWTAGFDVLYACQDYEVDVKLGMFSVPSRLGIRGALIVARLTHVCSAAMFLLLWWMAPQLEWIFACGLAVAIALLIYEHTLVKENDLSKLNLAFFTMNGVISTILGLTGIVDVLI